MKYGDMLRLKRIGPVTGEYPGRAMFIRYLTPREIYAAATPDNLFKGLLIRGSDAENDMVGRIYDLPLGPWVPDDE